MRILTLIVAVPLLVSYEAVFSQTIYKCVDESGTTIFSQSPCAVDAEKVYMVDDSSGMFEVRVPGQHVSGRNWRQPNTEIHCRITQTTGTNQLSLLHLRT